MSRPLRIRPVKPTKCDECGGSYLPGKQYLLHLVEKHGVDFGPSWANRHLSPVWRDEA